MIYSYITLQHDVQDGPKIGTFLYAL